jgi:hypothetical protein
MGARGIVAAVLLLITSCASTAPRPAASAGGERPAAPASLTSNPVESVPLDVVVTGQTTTGRVMKLRAKIVNPHAEPVTGVRLQLVFVAPAADGRAKILEIQQKEMSATIPAGGSERLHWDVESMYLGPESHFLLAAYPKRLGDKDMPPPDHWEEKGAR